MSMQMKAQRSGIYMCCEMLKKLHSVGLSTFCDVFLLAVVKSNVSKKLPNAQTV